MPPTTGMATAARQDPPRPLVKSAERVRDLGEVFTPANIVSDMLDLLPDQIWSPHPAPTFFEPAAGDGNFLVAILARKLDVVSKARALGELPAGDDSAACELHGLQALSSIYAVDISTENIVGGVPGHEVGARQRLLDLFTAWLEEETGARLNALSVLVASATWVIEHNVMVGNMLPNNADGSDSGRNQLPLVEYRWDPANGRVTVESTTLAQVELVARRRDKGEFTLLDALQPEPTVVWSGRPRNLHEAPIPVPPFYEGPPRNGNTRS